ncbi:MAG: glycosyltransferase [Candidatus Symbiothrix sp.]|jgi:glycosyltransferase involved in cell wall biosynthesis|nr:glycosyltransferase [Candidatus Symbiothrix sp.]
MNTYSLVIPTYNGERYIEQTLLSGFNQQRPFDEIIVSDDNSTDRTLAICEKYKAKIKLFKNENGPSGFVNGWNYAIAKATGDYISILHQDDLLDQSFLLEMAEISSENPDVLHFFSTCNYIDEKGNITGVSFPTTNEVIRYSGLEYVKAYQNLGNPHIHRVPGVITHRSIFEKMQYNPAAGHIADDDFFYRVGMFTDVIGLIKPLASYRLHNQSETGHLNNKQLLLRLANDNLFQVQQWKNSSFLDEESYHFFVYWAKKDRRRLLISALKTMDVKMFIEGIKIYFK